MSKIKLYGTIAFAPVRAVLLTLHALELDYELIELQLNADNEQPKLVDGDVTLLESHSICAYLSRKYGRDDDRLYPKDYQRRAIIDQWLHFDTGVLQHTCHKPIAIGLLKAFDGGDETIGALPGIQELGYMEAAYARLEQYLGRYSSADGNDDTSFIAGPTLSIADFSIVSSIADFHAFFVPITVQLHPNLSAWLARMQALPYYEAACGRGVQLLEDVVQRRAPKQFDKLWQKAFTTIKANNSNLNKQ